MYKGESRIKTFGDYLTQKYSTETHKKILDVGAGRMCKLATYLAKKGFVVDAIDPKIRLTNAEAKELGLSRISKFNFSCDEYAKNLKGTNIQNKDLIVGLEPCDATEHIIRQSLKYDKPFEIALCYQNHSALNGDDFNTVEGWYRHLKDISSDVRIQIIKNGNFVATNNPDNCRKDLAL